MSDDKYLKLGSIVNPLNKKYGAKPVVRACEIIVPARVNTFLCHHKYFTHPKRPHVYPVNSVNFSVSKFTKVKVETRNDEDIIVNADPSYVGIIKHAGGIMRNTLGIKTGFNIKAEVAHSFAHGGLGSSSSVSSAVAEAINMIMGNPIKVEDMVKLLSQNYGEESDREGFVLSGASIGGSSAIALSGKSLAVVGGESEIWALTDMIKNYSAVLMYPKKIKKISKELDNALNKKELSLLEKFDSNWEDIKENILKEKLVPEINKGEIANLFRMINMYTIGAFGDIPAYFAFRWKPQGVNFDSILYDIFNNLFKAMKLEEACFFVSSNGPLIAIITKNPKKVTALLSNLKKDFIFENKKLFSGKKYKLYK